MERKSVLLPNEFLSTGDYLVSDNKRFFALMQSDGNFCIYRGSGPEDKQEYVFGIQHLWAQKPTGDAFFAVLQTDGNFCVYKNLVPPGTTENFIFGIQGRWYHRPAGTDFVAKLHDDGTFTVSQGRPDQDASTLLWSTNPSSLDYQEFEISHNDLNYGLTGTCFNDFAYIFTDCGHSEITYYKGYMNEEGKLCKRSRISYPYHHVVGSFNGDASNGMSCCVHDHKLYFFWANSKGEVFSSYLIGEGDDESWSAPIKLPLQTVETGGFPKRPSKIAAVSLNGRMFVFGCGHNPYFRVAFSKNGREWAPGMQRYVPLANISGLAACAFNSHYPSIMVAYLVQEKEFETFHHTKYSLYTQQMHYYNTDPDNPKLLDGADGLNSHDIQEHPDLKNKVQFVALAGGAIPGKTLGLGDVVQLFINGEYGDWLPTWEYNTKKAYSAHDDVWLPLEERKKGNSAHPTDAPMAAFRYEKTFPNGKKINEIWNVFFRKTVIQIARWNSLDR